MRRIMVFLLTAMLILPFSRALAGGGVVEIVVTLTGDCTLGSEDRIRNKPTSFDSYISARGYGYPFMEVQSLFRHDDLTVINLQDKAKFAGV